MAGDKKLSELAALLGANTATGDLFLITDVSTGESKRITRAELIEALGPNFTELTVDTDTLHVDTVNGRVGIGTVTPEQELHISAEVPTIRLEDTDNNSAVQVRYNAGNMFIDVDPDDSEPSSTLIFNIDTFERVRLTTAGALLHGTTTAGSAGAGDIVVNGGIFLGGSAAANELNDYEEGTWTPVLSDGVNADATYVIQSGYYTKIGNKVHVQGQIQISSLGAISGNLQITGLPFTSEASANNWATLLGGYANNMNLTPTANITGTIGVNQTSSALRLWDVSVGTSLLQSTEFASNGDFIFSAEYIAA